MQATQAAELTRKLRELKVQGRDNVGREGGGGGGMIYLGEGREVEGTEC